MSDGSGKMSDKFNALDRRTRSIASYTGREHRIADLERQKEVLNRHHKTAISEINDLIKRLIEFNNKLKAQYDEEFPTDKE